MGKTFLKISVFVLILVGFFVAVGDTITALSGGGGPEIVTGEISPEVGEALFWGKGKCSTCHSIGTRGSAIRCPNLGVTDKFAEAIGIRAATRKEEVSAEAYLVESLYNPNAFVVEGFPKNLMTPINKPPIALSDDEIQAINLYLLSLSADVDEGTLRALAQAQAPYRSGKVQVEEAAVQWIPPEGDPEMGYYTFDDMKCHQCHTIEGYDFGGSPEDLGGIGPDLTGIGDIQGPLYLMESIMDPNALIVAGEGYMGEDGSSKMPEYHDTLTLRQLLDLTTFLTALKTEQDGG